jgi:hypothetical protein
MTKADGNIGERATSTAVLDIGIEVMNFLPGCMCIEQSEIIKRILTHMSDLAITR